MLLVRWRKSYGAVIDESLKAAVVPNVPNPAVVAARRKYLECRRTVLCYQNAFVGVAVKPVGKPDALAGHVRLCVQQRLAYSVGHKPTEARVRSLVAWIAGRRETKFLKPIDGIILGMMASHWAVTQVNPYGLESTATRRPSPHFSGEGSMERRMD